MSAKHNLFERSFGSKDLLDAHQPEYNISTHDRDSAGGSKDSPHSLAHSSASGSSGGIEIKPKTDLGVEQPHNAAETGVQKETPSAPSRTSDSNKNNLKLQNFQSVKQDRLPGLTPPLFTPGGPRLPPINSPGLPIGSPGTPGSNIWSSLLNVTNGSTNPHEQGGPTTHNPYQTMVRKISGLNPNESNLRSGLTPGGVNHGGFNFMLSNMPDGLANGQMTPGLQTLLSLAGTSNSNIHEAQLQGAAGPVGAAPPAVNYPGPQVGVYGPSGPVQNGMGSISEPKTEAVAPKPEPNPNLDSHTSRIPKEKPKTAKKRSGSGGSERPKKAAKAGAQAKGSVSVKEEPQEQERPDSPANEEEKRKQFLERNRLAASKCRQRKKQLFSKMESELSYYSKGFRDVSAQVVQLREQLMTLRGILLTHKDCPGLANAAGGYQQFQNILAKTEYMAQVSNASDSNYTSMPSTVPTTLNTTILPSKPMDTQPRGDMFLANEIPPNREHNAMAPMSRPINEAANGHTVLPAGVDERVPYDHGMPMPRTEAADTPDVFEGMQPMPKDNLRAINSASNLQNVKMKQTASSHGLRPISSMADMQLQNHNPGRFSKQFQL